jgi:hypothetical protein
MKPLLVLLSLAFASSSAFAGHGRPMIEIRYRSEIAAPTKTVALYASGLYQMRSYDEQGALTAASRGVLDKSSLRDVRGALQVAPWEITYSRIMCFAYSPSYTEYYVRGKLMWREQMCSGQNADDVTRQSLATIVKLLGQ